MTGLTSRRLLVGLTTMTLLAATGCAARDTSLPTLPTLSAAGVARQTPAADAPVAAVAKGMTALGWQLARTGSSASTNWVASPLSIAYAFGMARAGASGETAAEIDRAFGFPPAGVHEAFNAVTRQVVTTPGRHRRGRPPHPRAINPAHRSCASATACSPAAGTRSGTSFWARSPPSTVPACTRSTSRRRTPSR